MPKGYNVFSTLNPQQEQLFSRLAQALGGQNLGVGESPGYQQGLDFITRLLGGDTGQFEAPLMRQFQEEIVPGIAERFSGLGAGAQSSSAFTRALSQSGADLAERLGSLRGQLQLGALGPALQYAQAPGQQAEGLLGLSTKAFAPKSTPFWQQLLLAGIGKASEAGSRAATSALMGGL